MLRLDEDGGRAVAEVPFHQRRIFTGIGELHGLALAEVKDAIDRGRVSGEMGGRAGQDGDAGGAVFFTAINTRNTDFFDNRIIGSLENGCQVIIPWINIYKTKN